MEDPPVQYERRGHVATITLNRASAGNAIDEFLAPGIREAARRAIEDDEAYVVILTGAGHAFCVGGVDPCRQAEPATQALATLRVAGAIAAIPKPTVAAIDGDALGQGFELALACDLRIASAGARFSMDQVLRGFIPWDGGTQRLPRLISRGLAVEMILTGRAIESVEARDMGLVSQVVPTGAALGKALELAEKLAAMAPIAASYAKEAIVKGMDMPLDQGIRLEADLSLLLQTTRDRAEGLQAFLQRRKATFTGQ